MRHRKRYPAVAFHALLGAIRYDDSILEVHSADTCVLGSYPERSFVVFDNFPDSETLPFGVIGHEMLFETKLAVGQVVDAAEHGSNPDAALTVAKGGVDDVIGKSGRIDEVLTYVFDQAFFLVQDVESVVSACPNATIIDGCVSNKCMAKVL